MLALDSLVIDLIFQANAELDPEQMIEALGGEEFAASRKIVDPDMQDPRFEMEVSPSMPFRRRGERRLMIIDDSVAPMRKDPRADPVVPIDLREAKERLLSICKVAPVRLGRIFALGSMADAVLVAHDARDLRAICLLPWVLDPTVDVDGKKRASQLGPKEFEAKILAFDKRLEELDEEAILSDLGGATFVRDDDLLVVDVLEADGTWDLRKSLAMERALAAVERFSIIPGAPSSGSPSEQKGAAAEKPTEQAKPAKAAEPEPAPEPKAEAVPVAPMRSAEIGERVLLIFPRERFDLDAAAALGKRDYDAVLHAADTLTGQVRDRIYEHGADFVAPLEFLSEVFVDGLPLSRPFFDQNARDVGDGVRALDVHCPRFGPALLIDTPDGRFISSMRDKTSEVVRALAGS